MWFSYVLFGIFTIETICYIARAAGYEPERQGAGFYAFAAVVNALIAVGIWVWLI